MGSNQSRCNTSQRNKSCTPCKPNTSSSNRSSFNNFNQTMTKVVPGVICNNNNNNNKQRTSVQMNPVQSTYYQPPRQSIYTTPVPTHQPQTLNCNQQQQQQQQFRYQQNIQPSIQRTSTCCYSPAPQPYHQYHHQQPQPQHIRQYSYNQPQMQSQRTSQYNGTPQTMNCRQQQYYYNNNNNNNNNTYVPSYNGYYNNNSYNNSYGCGGCQPVY
jgi:hypothetical protein